MKALLSALDNLKAIKPQVEERLAEFKAVPRTDNRLFQELCFCILAANFQSGKMIEIQKKIGNGFLAFPEKKLQKELKLLGCRFHNRAAYIVENRKNLAALKNALDIFKGEGLREWIVKHIKGLGYKEASHFLRNIGFDDYAIIDFHIVDILEKHKLIRKPKTMTKKRYLEIEKVLQEIGSKSKMTMAELDLYLWYLETGKVLK